ncbi:hypothetical protein V5O48_016372 [Marasmius crinis-equi]|uniref:2OGFeDO JBP1/TET oxygenase domain-containing protein n=1 Tax=Marasmius crinis-equi TaxID=585013 RepID=A0ABR3ERX0_9AGAR
MSSIEEFGWTRKLRSGKIFSQLAVPSISIQNLITPALEKEAHAWLMDEEESEDRGVEEEEKVIYAGDWCHQPSSAAAPSSVDSHRKSDPSQHASTSNLTLEDLPPLTRTKKRTSLEEPSELPNQSQANARRAKRRRRDFKGHEAQAKAHPQPHSEPIATVLLSKSLPSKSDACTAKNAAFEGEFDGAKTVYTLEEMRRMGYRIIGEDDWDGVSSLPIVDAEGRVIAVLVGRPNDDGYVEDAKTFHQDILQKRTLFVGEDESQDRGDFPAQAIGIAYGLGQPYPERLKNPKYGKAVEEILETPSAKRIASFQSAAYSRWSPENYRRYSDAKEFIQNHEKTRDEHWNFERSVFAAATVNFGPQTRTFKHRDVQNAPFGWCAVTALGDFDASLGGHLVLWDLGLVIRFPAGSTILLPSATIAHSNIPIRDGETRTSFTQYSAGCLFRWVDCGGRNLQQLRAKDRAAYRQNRKDLVAKTYVAEGVERFSTLDYLVDNGYIQGELV